MMSFGDYMSIREGVLAAEPTAGGLPRTNTTTLTQARRKQLIPTPVRTPEPLAPTIRPVASVVQTNHLKSNRLRHSVR